MSTLNAAEITAKRDEFIKTMTAAFVEAGFNSKDAFTYSVALISAIPEERITEERLTRHEIIDICRALEFSKHFSL